MQLTYGYRDVLADRVTARYEIREVRNAAKVMQSTAPDALQEIMDVLTAFRFGAGNLLLAGKNESENAREFNKAVRQRGWRESRVDTKVQHTLVTFPYTPIDGSVVTRINADPDEFEGYKADWVKNRIAGDMEWNAKDGNLDRNFASYRSLYEAGFIDGAILVTRTQEDLRTLERELLNEMLSVGAERAAAVTGHPVVEYQNAIDRIREMRRRNDGRESKTELRLSTSTSTNLEKLVHRLRRGDGGGCPILVVAICARTFDGVRLTGPLHRSEGEGGHDLLVTTEEDEIEVINPPGGER